MHSKLMSHWACDRHPEINSVYVYQSRFLFGMSIPRKHSSELGLNVLHTVDDMNNFCNRVK